ncbi:MAG TPA: ribosome assembly factor SBDS [Candidatus Nanoarchaeia archaeon]|nr:ribosome assembly factor SBDS [Candidatus Nanoarchaeia archaeon]
MANTTARIKKCGKEFEIMVDLDRALQLKEGKNVSVNEILGIDAVFLDSKKGQKAPESDLQKAFKTSDIYAVAAIIIKEGQVMLPLEYKKKERDEKTKQIIDLLLRNAIDPRTGRPHTPERIASALEECGISIENKPAEEQLGKIIEKIKGIIPIKIETKKIALTIPAVHTGKAYGLLNAYKESEEWLPDGSLKCILNIPSGMQMDFYDKINSMTHGAVLSEEIK